MLPFLKKWWVLLACIVAGVFAVVSTLVFSVGWLSVNGAYVRWDKIPFFGALLLQVDKPSGLEASCLEEPIRWDQLEEAPAEWTEEFPDGNWFYLNPYTKNLLTRYMRDNNLGIVPANYADLHLSADFEEVMELFTFVELDEAYRSVDAAYEQSKAAVRTVGFVATAGWGVFLALLGCSLIKQRISNRKTM